MMFLTILLVNLQKHKGRGYKSLSLQKCIQNNQELKLRNTSYLSSDNVTY